MIAPSPPRLGNASGSSTPRPLIHGPQSTDTQEDPLLISRNWAEPSRADQAGHTHTHAHTQHRLLFMRVRTRWSVCHALVSSQFITWKSTPRLSLLVCISLTRPLIEPPSSVIFTLVPTSVYRFPVVPSLYRTLYLLARPVRPLYGNHLKTGSSTAIIGTSSPNPAS